MTSDFWDTTGAVMGGHQGLLAFAVNDSAPKWSNYNNYINNYVNNGDNNNNNNQHLHHLDDYNNRTPQQPPPFLPGNSALFRFHELYLQVHGYASVLVCVFGVITNVINISVLAVKDMRTPTNNFLISLAVSDILTMLPYIPFCIHFFCPVAYPINNPELFSYGWIVFMLITIQVIATTHAISIWLAVSLAAFRYSQIRAPCPRGPLARERRIRHVKITIILVCVISVVVLIPNYMSHRIALYQLPMPNSTYYGLQEIKMGTPDTDPVVLTNICVFAVLAKIVPCILIFIFSGSLLYHMGIKTTRRRHRLSVAIQQAKTTRMLLVVLILFICTELPQGILILISASVPNFHDQVFTPLGDFIDFVSLLNNAVNFVLYCTMSQQFREKFESLYIERFCWWCRRRAPLQPSASELLVLREQVPKTTTTTTHFQEDGQTTLKL